MNAKKVPQLFVATGATKFSEDPKTNQWTMGWQPSYQSEGQIYGKYILQNHPNAKIGVLYQNDDYGKDVYKGLKDGLGDKAKSMIISEATYEVSEPTIDSQILKLKAAGADLFMDITTPKFAAQAIKKVAEIGWKPLHILNNVSISTASVLKPAGLENAKDVVSAGYLKDPTDPKTRDDPTLKDYYAFLDKYLPDIDQTNGNLVYGYGVSQTMEQVLKQCGDNLTRENIMKQAASLKDFVTPVFLPGVKANTGPNDYFVIEQLQMMKFDGQSWQFFGPILSAEAKS
jgi:ABC-type branched-subunit amino acid transport system substrate-binding protein